MKTENSSNPIVSSPAPPRGFFVLLDTIFLLALIAAMCCQINLGDIGRDTTAEGYVTKQLKIALPDIALFLCFAWFFVRTTWLRAWRKLWWPPVACWALIAAMLLSIMHSRPLINALIESLSEAHGIKQMLATLKDTKESKEAIAETIQFIGYFLIAPLLFVNLIHDRRMGVLHSRRRIALWTFFLALAGVTLLALWQLLQGSESPRAWFGSPNAYAAFCALAMPLLLSRLATGKVKSPLAIGLLVCAVCLIAATLVSAWALISILIALAVAGILLRVPGRVALAVAGAGVLVILLWPRQMNLQPLRAQSLQLGSGKEKVKKQFVEWHVGASRLADRREASFATGAGPGNYQFNIGSYYARLPNEEKMPPDSNNLFLVQAVNLGVLGLGALLWVIAHFAQVAFAALRQYSDDWLASGVLASLASWLIVNCFHASIVRGTGVVLAFMLALAVIALQRKLEPDVGKEERNQMMDWMS